jgi:hypothetical protein
MWNIEKMYRVSMICSIFTAIVMLALYLYAGIRFSGWIWGVTFLGPTALFLFVILCALIYSHILVKKAGNDSDST